MAYRALPSVEVLRQLLRYDPGTGKLFWKGRAPDLFAEGGHSQEHRARLFNDRYAGTEALSAINRQGYPHGSVLGCNYLAHRVIWALVTGECLDAEIDHIDGNPANNRIENLRVVDRKGNMMNVALRKKNTTGAHGIQLMKSGKWRARIKDNGREVHLGYFYSKDAAIAARKAAQQKYGYHANHGRPE
jgi:hypothetical protein